MTRLIINADDFGLDSSATRAILNLVSGGRMISTSVVSNTVAAEDLTCLKQAGPVSIGLHVNLVEGKPLCDSDRVRSLTDSTGGFLSLPRLLGRAFAGRICPEEVAREVNRQLDFLIDHGVSVSHADSHQHCHALPVIGPMILEALRARGIARIRNCRLTQIWHKRMFVLGALTVLTRRSVNAFTRPDALLTEFSVEGRANLQIFKRALKRGARMGDTLEWMTHPALQNTPSSYLNRIDEYNFWQSDQWRNVLSDHQISLIPYNEL